MIGPLAIALVAVQQHESTAAWKAIVALFLLQACMGIMAWRLFRPRGSDDDGSSGGGGQRRPDRRPPGPLPPGPICWQEFEREFAEHVAHRERAQSRR